MILLLILALNFGISWWNCYALGGIWAEARALGGWPRFLAWCGATQAAIGFSSVALALFAGIAYATGHLPDKALQAAAGLWYLLVIIPALGTGLALTIQSWIVAFRERSIANMGIAAYNTLAQVHNLYGAIDGIGQAFGAVKDMLPGFGGDSDSDSDSAEAAMALLIIGLVIGALLSGVLLTGALIARYSGRLALPARSRAATA